MTFSYRNGVSVAEIVVYIPCLAVAVFLCIRHGFGRSSGWMFLIIFCLARIIGPCMQLATISSPDNTDLYIGSSILQNVGLSPLQLAAIGLLSRLLENINKSTQTFFSTRMLKAIELVVIVAFILAIVGGVNAGDTFSSTGKYQPGSLSKAGTIIFIVSYLAIVAATAMISFSVSHAEKGEKRILTAVAISLPFLLVRLVYSIFSTFSHNPKFNVLIGSPTILLCVALIEELIVVLTYEITGLTLSRVERIEHPEGAQIVSGDSTDYSREAYVQHPQKQDNTMLRIAKKTIIGRIVMSVVGDDQSRDNTVEMDRQRRRRHHSRQYSPRK